MRAYRGIVVTVGLLILACGDSTEKPVAVEKFEGILRTDQDCNILGGDTSDFLPRPEAAEVDTTVFPPVAGFPGNNSLIYTCPNPAETTTQTYFQLSEPDSVLLLLYDRPGAPPVDTLFTRGDAPGGVFMVTWNNPKGPGIYRIRMFTAKGFRSYGDVEFTGAP